ncbi:hypothetical protein [Halomicronema hongdechloris]|uniref:hypothetical protein n=1 Tax=Halomicronema hongdechloris TaxID=1209493 RepID=UPI0010CBBCEB|nr:hypothetical protein [Halomicronema hongdechloris]
MERPPTIARGVSPVEDNLADITGGWEDSPPPARGRADTAPEHRAAAREYETPQSPKRVYQSGSLYSYSYRNREADPEDAAVDDEEVAIEDEESLASVEPHDIPAYEYEEEPDEPERPHRPPTPGPDGVYDADYRVIIPPHRPLEDEDA